MKIAIIGAGMAGLAAAHALQTQMDDASIQVFEKSRGVGRIATRYHDVFQFDFGAPYFRVKTDAFAAFLTPYIASKQVTQWQPRIGKLQENGDISAILSQYPYFTGSPKMTSLGRAIASDLKTPIQFKIRVNTLEKTAMGWQLYDVDGNQLGEFDWVICAAPLEQAQDLLPITFAHKALLDQCKTDACYALMLGCKTDKLPKQLSELLQTYDIVTFTQADTPLATLVNDSAKQALPMHSLTLFSKNTWAEQQVDNDIDAVKQSMLLALAKSLAIPLNELQASLTHSDIHRWRYANVNQSIQQLNADVGNCLCDSANKLIAVGDWCTHGSVEGAFLSGISSTLHMI